jgi:glycosyltransferase involved in cell wall biosynthesis
MAIRVSAIVSAYNAQMFLRGRLDDLMAQTLYKRGELEIIVVNSGSTDTTGAILEREYLPHITLIQTPFRESMYAAWNRAIKLAKGDYIIPANVDDRLHPDACEIMANYLMLTGSDMVCPDSYVTATPNVVWEDTQDLFPLLSMEAPYTAGRLDFANSPYPQTQQCRIGNTPMWRKSLHETVGYFDTSYLIAGDYEWALRLEANARDIGWIRDILGLFYFHPSTQGRAYAEQSAYESRRAVLKWKGMIERGQHDRQAEGKDAHKAGAVPALG